MSAPPCQVLVKRLGDQRERCGAPATHFTKQADLTIYGCQACVEADPEWGWQPIVGCQILLKDGASWKPCGEPATHMAPNPITLVPVLACRACAEASPPHDWRPIGARFEIHPPERYPLRVRLPMPDAPACAKCLGIAYVELEVTRSDYSVTKGHLHASTCPTFFCSHGVPWEGARCERCEAEEVAAIEERTYLRSLCRDVAEAIQRAGLHYDTDTLWGVAEGIGEWSGGDANECRNELLETPRIVLSALPAELRTRVREATQDWGPLAFLAVGEEQLEDVLADAKVAFPDGSFATEIRLAADGHMEDSLAKLLHRRVAWARKMRGHLGASVSLGIAWRARRAARRAS